MGSGKGLATSQAGASVGFSKTIVNFLVKRASIGPVGKLNFPTDWTKVDWGTGEIAIKGSNTFYVDAIKKFKVPGNETPNFLNQDLIKEINVEENKASADNLHFRSVTPKKPIKRERPWTAGHFGRSKGTDTFSKKRSLPPLNHISVEFAAE